MLKCIGERIELKRYAGFVLLPLILILCALCLSSLFAKRETDKKDEALLLENTSVPGNLSGIRQRRDDARREELRVLDEAIKADDEYSPICASYRSMLIKNIEDEMVIEDVALTKGYFDVCAIVSGEKVYVVILSDSLSEEGALLIKDTAVRQCGINANDVCIILDSGGE
ncbi:MAG: SpoIIIAH-like family protein [Clostridiales bacterium]|nr:SpoIIIAH-like family protein [Clostridiales bacterium]